MGDQRPPGDAGDKDLDEGRIFKDGSINPLDEKVKSLVMEALMEHFADEVEFDNVVVERALDQYGDGDGSEYLRILIFYSGTQASFDPAKTPSLIRLIRPKLFELGIEAFPSPRFVAGSKDSRERSRNE